MSNKNYRDDLVIAANQKIKEREYWHDKLAGDLVKSAFPYDSRNVTGQSNIEIIKFTFAGELFTGLMKLGSHSDYTLHIILLANLSILLSKYFYHWDSGGKDIILGTPIYKQDIRGEFVNTVLAVRNKIDDNITYKELLIQVKQTVIEALENYSYPIEVLVEELGLPLTESDFPLFDVTLMLENIQEKKYMMHIPTNMVFSFLRNRDSIEARVEYNPLRFFNTTVKRIVDQLIRLTSRVIFNIETKLGDIDILAETERKRLLEEFNNTAADIPPYFLLHQWFERQAVQNLNKVALTWSGDETYDVIRHMSYKDLNEKANQLAHELRLRGVKRGSIVAIIMKSQPELVIGILAILKAGGAYLPIDHEYPQERIVSILDDSGVSMVLTRSVILDKFSYTAIQGLKHARVEPHKTGVRPQSDFDSIPHPDRSLIDGEKYGHYIGHAMVRHAISIQGTRGCPYQCAFCHRTMENRNVARSAENIFEEVKYYYHKGVRRFSFVDEIFNLDVPNSMRFFRLVLKNKMKLQLFFPNGMRADRLTRDYIDLMVEAGTVNVGLALETASPRLQKLIRKNLDIEKLRENAGYFCTTYPHVILELFTMHGFPTETEEEALSTLDFIKSLKWVHFPYVFLLKIHPSTDMFKLALESGISMEAIQRSMTAAFHEIPETLPFPKSFTRQYMARFLNEYFLSRERLLHLLPYQMKIASEKELVAKYDNYLPAKIMTFNDIIENVGISREELGGTRLIGDDSPYKPDYGALKISRYQVKKPKEDALRVLLIDLSVLFSHEKKDILHGEITEPLGLLYLLTYLRETFKDRVNGKIAKAKIDFDNFEELKILVCDFKPHLIGIRTLSYFKDFFHKTIALIKEWGITAPIITGGPYGTSDYKLVLQDPKVELTVLKEGEITLGQLVEKMMANHNKLPGEDVLETIKGIAFTRKEDRAQLKNHSRELLCLDKSATKLSRHPTGNLENVNRPEDLLYLISTSGTTGVPKSVMIEHGNLANLIRFQFSKTNIDFSKVLQFASIGFDVSAQEIFSTLLWGGVLVLIDKEVKNNPPLLFKVIRENQVTTLFLPPAFLKYIFSDPSYAGQFPGVVKHIVAAGEQLFVTKPIEKYLKENRVYLHNHYGPSETHVVTALTLDPTHTIPGRPSIGKPISNTRVYILDEKKNLMPGGAVGELCIAGANLGRGYYKDQMLTESKFIDNPFEKGQRLYLTGDLARWLPEGNLEFIGKTDMQVKIRGFRVELGEIEKQLLKNDIINEAVVIDRDDLQGDKYLCAYVVAAADEKNDRDRGNQIDTNEIKTILANFLPGYMIPTYIIQLEKIPLTRNGKVNRRWLPTPGIKTSREYTAPRHEVEEKLADLWSEILDLEKNTISIDDNFFEMGGHSLRATLLSNHVHKVFQVEMPLAEIFKQPTIRKLSAYIKRNVKFGFVSIEPVEKKEYYRLSSTQKRLYILQQMETDNMAYDIPAIMELEGKVPVEKLEEAVKRLIDRHESLRTSFHMIEGQPVQRVQDGVEFEINYFLAAENAADPVIKNFIRPFDLARAPLLRVGLIETAEQEYLLIIDMHHIVMDGTSMGIFIKEFMKIYKGETLAPLKLQYKDYSRWQNTGKEKKKQEKYWKKKLEGNIPHLELPVDYPGNVGKNFEGSVVRFRVIPEQTRALKEFAAEENTTLFILLLVIFNVMLWRITGQEDIVMGTPVEGRRHADLGQTIGMFVNTVVLRNFLTGDKSFKHFLQEVNRGTQQAMENQDYPLEDLVQLLGIAREAGRNPIFDVLFAIQNMEIPGLKIPGLKLEPYHYEINKSRFHMTMTAAEMGEELHFSIRYSTGLFKVETIRQFTNYYKEILTTVLENRDIILKEILLTYRLRDANPDKPEINFAL